MPQTKRQNASNQIAPYTVPYASALELRMEILKYGAEVEVLAPPELRAAIAREAAQMAARYADETGAPSMASLSR